ncbi:MAG TPA: DNA topoisomerase IB [Thermoanaerobaculia bacterium]|jgi:DNA topoisomerase-1|nr:DNA topoisomerase IB [Thermoanaerobaculia bacterium]
MLESLAREPVDDPQAVAADPVLSARLAGLRHVTDAKPGIRRRRRGTGFSYLDPAGQPLRDPRERRRIDALAVPPAWTEVWICPLANGHLQATGRDARGRKQYRYHPHWRAVRDETKFGRMVAFGEALPRLRTRLDSDLALPGLPREKVLAAVVKLLGTTLIRVGNEEYARENESFGLTTMRSRHVDIAGATLRFRFRGKSGREHEVAISDRRLARVVRACRELPGHELFQYVDESGERQAVDSADVNEYLRDVTGEDFTAKDFRTWGGTVLALAALCAAGAVRPAAQDGEEEDDEECEAGAPPSARGANREREARRAIVEAVKRVAAQLGNRPAICRKYYVHPAVIAAFLDGRLQAGGAVRRLPPPGSLPELEALTLALLRGLPPGVPPPTASGKKRAPRNLPERRRRHRDPAVPLGALRRSTRSVRSTPSVRSPRSISAASPLRLRR